MKEIRVSLITKNILSLFMGQGISLFLNFLVIALAARYLGVKDFGSFSSMQAVVGIIATIVDFGFTPIVFREVTKNRQSNIISAALSIRIAAIYALLIAFNIFSFIAKIEYITVILLNMLIFNIGISSKMINIRGLLEVPFKVDLKMQFPMVLNILDNLILLCLTLLTPFFQFRLFYFVIVFSLSNLPGFFILLRLLRRKYDLKLSLSWENSKWLLMESLPVYGFVVVSAFYQQSDILILKYMDSTYAAGIYSVAMRLTIPLYIIAYAITSTSLPSIVNNLADNEGKNDRIFRIIYKLLFIIPFLIAIVFTFKSSVLIKIIFGAQFIQASFSTIILMWSQIFVFHSYFTLDILISYNRQKYNFLYSFLYLFVSLGLDLLLIPHYSYAGASVAKLAASFVSFVYLLIVLKRLKYTLYPRGLNVLTWVLVMCIIQFLLSFLPLVLYLTASAICIVLYTYFSNLFSVDEILLMLRMINKEEWKSKVLSRKRLQKTVDVE